jgi:hypothetical protein
VPGAAGEAVKGGHGHYVELAPPGIGHEPLQFGTLFLAAAGPVRVDGHDLPAALVTKTAELFLLNLGTLAEVLAVSRGYPLGGAGLEV